MSLSVIGADEDMLSDGAMLSEADAEAVSDAGSVELEPASVELEPQAAVSGSRAAAARMPNRLRTLMAELLHQWTC